MINDALYKETAINLSALAKRVESAEFAELKEISIDFDSINEHTSNGVKDDICKWEKMNKGCRYIYIIQADNRTDIEKCFREYYYAKDQKKGDRAFARVNQPSDIFYVGSSKSLGDRIKQHLGFGPQGTYALQMVYWIKGITGKANISIWRFNEIVEQEVIQAIEDSLWVKYKPMFGRKGAK